MTVWKTVYQPGIDSVFYATQQAVGRMDDQTGTVARVWITTSVHAIEAEARFAADKLYVDGRGEPVRVIRVGEERATDD